MDDSAKLDEILKRIKRIEDQLGITDQVKFDEMRRRDEHKSDTRRSLTGSGLDQGPFEAE